MYREHLGCMVDEGVNSHDWRIEQGGMTADPYTVDALLTRCLSRSGKGARSPAVESRFLLESFSRFHHPLHISRRVTNHTHAF